MKTLAQYINEMFEYRGDYDTAGNRMVILARRENIDCKNLNEDEFVDMMIEDFEEAYDDFRSNVKYPSKEEIEKKVERDMVQQVRYAEKKWKTEKRRAEYLDPIRFKRTDYINQLISGSEKNLVFRWDIGNYEIPAWDQPENIKMSNKNFRDIARLKAMYKDLIKNKWFQMANGWEFITFVNKEWGISFNTAIITPLYADESIAKEKARLKKIYLDWDEEFNSRWYGQGRYMGD